LKKERALSSLCSKVALLLDRGDLHGEHLQWEHAPDEELAQERLDLGWDAAPLVQQ
jgi:hypothetical protein